MPKQLRYLPAALVITAIAASVGAVGCRKDDNAATEGQKAGAAAPAASSAAATPGVTASEIKIGQSMPYSGPASSYGAIGKAEVAYFKMINDQGGINGHKITLISLDDAYSPPKAIENTRKLVEGDGVAFIFNNVGTANNTAIQKYLNDNKVPQLFVATGADKWADPEHFPWTIGFAPSYRLEARVLARYLLKQKPNAKLCVIFQNDDFGKDYLQGLKEGLDKDYDKIVIKSVSYEPTDPTVDSQVVTLQGAGCDTLLTAATPRAAIQVIRKVYDLGWKPLHLLSNTSISRAAVLATAGLDKSIGILTAGYIKDINDPALANDPGMNEFRAFAKQYLPNLDPTDGNLTFAYGVSKALTQVLKQCGDDFSRANIMKQAANLKDLQLPVITNGILLNTSPTDFRPYSDMQLGRFNGNNFEPVGDKLNAD
jgi:branched-chain amino acid transport system substrate-binding protein